MFVSGGSEYVRLLRLQKQAIQTRDRLDTAAQEMTTGLKASRFEATGGNLTRLFAIERSLDRNAMYRETLSLAELRIDMAQESLGRMLTSVQDVSINLVSATGLGDYTAAMSHARAASEAFTDTIAVLNTQVAGQSLFAGATTDGKAVADAATILADLGTALAGATTAADAQAAIDDYFANVFPTSGYLGSTTDLTPVDIGEGHRLDFALRADDAKLVAVLKSQAMAAVVSRGLFTGGTDEQMALLASAGAAMLDAKEGLLDLRGDLGSVQEAVAKATAARTAERETLDLARTAIVTVDPLEATSAYQQLEVQLEAVYTVTARIASLRFVNYMS